MDQDDTLKALEGFNSQRLAARDRDEQTEQNSDDSDLFLKLAREEAAGAARVNRRVCSTAPPLLGSVNISPVVANNPPVPSTHQQHLPNIHRSSPRVRSRERLGFGPSTSLDVPPIGEGEGTYGI